MFGFGEKKEKEREQRKVKWVAPTTGNVYYEDENLPSIRIGGDWLHDFTAGGEWLNDDWIDCWAPEHAKRNRQDSENIGEIKEMVAGLLHRQEELERMMASLIRRQYDREQRETKAEVENETEYQR